LPTDVASTDRRDVTAPMEMSSSPGRTMSVSNVAIEFSKTNLFIQDRCLIGDSWVCARDGRTFEVNDPATGAFVANVPLMGTAETRAAIEAAHAAFASWSRIQHRSGQTSFTDGNR
jgi:hypothetical protein